MLKRSRLKAGIAGIALLSAHSAVSAATLSIESGEVRVKREKGFRAVHGDVKVSVGEQVLVPPEGRARIVYDNKCVMQLPAGVWKVQDEKFCDPSVTGAVSRTRRADGAAAAVVSDPGPDDLATPGEELDSAAIPFVALAMGVAAGAAIGSSVSSGGEGRLLVVTSPASP